MDINETLDGDLTFEFTLSPEMISFLRETARWAKFIAIMGFLSAGIMIVLSFTMGFFVDLLGAGLEDSEMALPSGGLVFVYLLSTLVMLMPVIYLYKFASNMQLALNNNDQLALRDSFKNLKSHYKFYGIVLAISLGLVSLLFLLMVMFIMA